MKPILFIDFYRTICHDRYWRSLPLDLQEKVEVFFKEEQAIINDWMIGKYTAREVNNIIAQKIGIPFEELWEVFVADCKTMNISKETLSKISSLREKFTVILMTGNMDNFNEFTIPALGLQKHFDHISNSFDEQKQKKDDNGALFAKYIHKFNSSFDASFVIDDTISVCKLFIALGGTAFQVTPEKSIDDYLDFLSTHQSI